MIPTRSSNQLAAWVAMAIACMVLAATRARAQSAEVLIRAAGGGRITGHKQDDKFFVHCSGMKIPIQPGDKIEPTDRGCRVEPSVPRGFAGAEQAEDKPR